MSHFFWTSRFQNTSLSLMRSVLHQPALSLASLPTTHPLESKLRTSMVMIFRIVFQPWSSCFWPRDHLDAHFHVVSLYSNSLEVQTYCYFLGVFVWWSGLMLAPKKDYSCETQCGCFLYFMPRKRKRIKIPHQVVVFRLSDLRPLIWRYSNPIWKKSKGFKLLW